MHEYFLLEISVYVLQQGTNRWAGVHGSHADDGVERSEC